MIMIDERALLVEATHEQAMRYMRYIIKHSKDEDDVVEVFFRKKNGRIRKARVHFDDEFVDMAVKNIDSPRILKIKKTNKERDNFVVVEQLPNGKYQFRTVPLRNVTQIRKNGKKVKI